MTSIIQSWVHELPLMQQGVLLCSIRGPDGIKKYHPMKYLLRWYRRAILLHSFNIEGNPVKKGQPFTLPHLKGGGSFLGPSYEGDEEDAWQVRMNKIVDDYMKTVDEIPMHCHVHFLHAVEVLGYKHPDLEIREWWHGVYIRLVHDLHLWPETEEQLDSRLGDDLEKNIARNDISTLF